MKTSAAKTTYTDTFEDADGPEIDIIPGREAPKHTAIHDWISLADISPGAVALYGKLKMHLNRERGDSVCWPSTLVLAKMMGRSRGDKITGEMQELVALQVVEIHSYGMPRRHVYTIHETPPDGYRGPMTLKDWYARNRAELDAAREAAKAKRDARRKRNEEVSAVTPDSGEQPVAPDRGEQVTPSEGQLVAPDRGREPTRSELTRKEPPPNPPTGPPAAAVGAAVTRGEISPLDEQDRELLRAARAQALQEKPGWTLDAVQRAMQTALDSGRLPAEVAEAIIAAAVDGGTQYPSRINNEIWWDSTLGARFVPAPPPLPADQRCQKGGHIGQPAVNCPLCITDARVEAADKAREERDAAAARQPAAAPQSRRGRLTARAAT